MYFTHVHSQNAHLVLIHAVEFWRCANIIIQYGLVCGITNHLISVGRLGVHTRLGETDKTVLSINRAS
jgi:hypothetical protein